MQDRALWQLSNRDRAFSEQGFDVGVAEAVLVGVLAVEGGAGFDLAGGCRRS